MSKRTKKDLVGQVFGFLTVVSEESPVRYSKGYRYYWKCQCECGNFVVIREDTLLARRSPYMSCGCHRGDGAREYNKTHTHPVKHGHSHEQLYNIWYLIRYRCNNPKCSAYDRYGGRGISVCTEWDDETGGYDAFCEWSKANGYTPGLTIDRIDNDMGYQPDNCRWVDMQAQNRNKRHNVWLEYQGERKLACQWAEELGMPYKTLMNRIRLNWPIDKIINQPLRKRSTKNTA